MSEAPPSTDRGSGRRPSAARLLAVGIPIGVGVVGFALARAAMLQGVGLWDTAELQVVAPLMGTAHPTGYPTYVLLGWLASVVLQPLGDPAFRMNLLAALLAGATAGLAARVVHRLTGRAILAAGAGLAVATLPVVWRLGTHADVHGLHGALVALLLALLVEWEATRRDRFLVGASVVYGLALGNQGLTALLAPGIAAFVLAVERSILVRRPRLVAGCALVVVASAGLVYLELPIRAGILRAPIVYGHPDTLSGFLYVVTGSQFTGTFASTDAAARVAEAVRRIVDQLGPLAGVVPLAALVVAAVRPRYALLTIPAVLLTAWFAGSYVNAEIDRYWLGPALIAVTWLAVAAGGIIDRWERLGREAGKAGEAVEPASDRPVGARLGVVLLEVAAVLVLLAPFLADVPARFASVNRSRDAQGQAWLDRTFRSLPPSSVVVSWWDYSTPMWYGQLIEGRRPDILVVDDRTRLDERLGEVTDVIDAYLGRRPVFIIRLAGDMPALEARYRLSTDMWADGVPIQVLGRRSTP